MTIWWNNCAALNVNIHLIWQSHWGKNPAMLLRESITRNLPVKKQPVITLLYFATYCMHANSLCCHGITIRLMEGHWFQSGLLDLLCEFNGNSILPRYILKAYYSACFGTVSKIFHRAKVASNFEDDLYDDEISHIYRHITVPLRG